MTVRQFDGHTVTIDRADRAGNGCSLFGSSGNFRAVYTGKIRGDEIEGTVSVLWAEKGHVDSDCFTKSVCSDQRIARWIRTI